MRAYTDDRVYAFVCDRVRACVYSIMCMIVCLHVYIMNMLV